MDSPTAASPSSPLALEDAGLSAEQLLDWISHHQAQPEHGTPYLDQTPDGVRADLEGLDQDWTQTVRVVLAHGEPVAACAVEWDSEPSSAWIQGPIGAPEAVLASGEALVQAMIDQLPEDIQHLEMFGDVRNTAMAELAQRWGWTPTEVNQAMSLGMDRARELADQERAGATESGSDADPAPGSVQIRPATSADLPGLGRLHEVTFPDTYATTAQLLTHHTTLVAVQDGQVLGYAAGQVQAEGSGYVDFSAVDPGHRGRGLGRRLVRALIAQLVDTEDAQRMPRVHLTVREDNTAAQQLYTSLGFSVEAGLRAYRHQRA